MGRKSTRAKKSRLEQGAHLTGEPLLAEVVDPIEQLITRARKLRLRGDVRGALVVLRQAGTLDEGGPRTWPLLGALRAQLGQVAEASRAYNKARWLRLRAGEKARAAVTEELSRRLLQVA